MLPMYIARNPSPSSEANDFLRPGSVLGFDQRDTLIVGRIARDSVEYYVLYMAYVAAASLMYTVRVSVSYTHLTLPTKA